MPGPWANGLSVGDVAGILAAGISVGRAMTSSNPVWIRVSFEASPYHYTTIGCTGDHRSCFEGREFGSIMVGCQSIDSGITVAMDSAGRWFGYQARTMARHCILNCCHHCNDHPHPGSFLHSATSGL